MRMRIYVYGTDIRRCSPTHLLTQIKRFALMSSRYLDIHILVCTRVIKLPLGPVGHGIWLMCIKVGLSFSNLTHAASFLRRVASMAALMSPVSPGLECIAAGGFWFLCIAIVGAVRPVRSDGEFTCVVMTAFEIPCKEIATSLFFNS